MSSTLIDLPSEILILIIQYVLQDPPPPPVEPCEANRIVFKDMRGQAWQGGCGKIYHEKHNMHGLSGRLPLLLTNRQLSTMTKWVWERFARNHVLDIALRDDLDLFPTWQCIPATTNRIKLLAVDIRLMGHVISPDKARKQTRGNVSRGFHWSFYRLLERFLLYGAVGELEDLKTQGNGSSLSSTSLSKTYPETTFEDRDVTVQTLVIDVTSAARGFQIPPDDPDNIWNLRWFHQHRGEIYDGLDGYATRPEWVAGTLARKFSQLLSMTYHTAQHGKFMYERVGRIHLLVNGEVRWEFNLSKKLRELHFENPNDTFGNLNTRDRIEFFQRWKEDTLQRRQDLGLLVYLKAVPN
ncbi:hypothetical protein N7481_006622 [Penicillium waksmanii]|uniref:uncharacterized protein n=1 Tax=Penicillium waksmanii TaxID=69791 RepID=UPI0025492CC7|nr:uncharacterized protein N7481_006622 [Penicillium waksmanii]KAJ5984523.1 hypothetical protein N7481_006622 [Penicillium waksmanii]